MTSKVIRFKTSNLIDIATIIISYNFIFKKNYNYNYNKYAIKK